MRMMQIVIELSDETYDKVINPHNWYDPNSVIKDIVKAIENGTPLSKTIDSLKELSKDHRHNYVGNSYEERAWKLGIEDSIDLILAESEGT